MLLLAEYVSADEALRWIVVEQRLDDDDIIESVYGSQAFRDGVASFVSGSKR